ncbi:type II toxin-antitoxin system VapC family toxin [Marinobacterium sp. D7]|uniref:type II toxin-antitoxin system VapC family toxin n=1 Tax=Marinobacterium ramblicola TaxID=2849041 RepID=UPI001C2CD95D|nr:type II toxin-antitoxin system VapC family toxin [Marinobacterium ramblicola]
MKRLLLDTHVLLWWLSDDAVLGTKAKEVIANPQNQVYVSAASTWEISIKRSLGKLQTPDDMSSIIEEEGFLPLPVSLYHGDQAGQLPDLHKDPFDRMLIAQAQAEGLIIVTHDEAVTQYPVRTMAAKR